MKARHRVEYVDIAVAAGPCRYVTSYSLASSGLQRWRSYKRWYSVINKDWIKIADSLMDASRDCSPIPPISESYDNFDVTDAYEIQLELARRRIKDGAIVKGHKVGLTSEAMRLQLGVNEPDYGHLFDDMFYPDNGTVPLGKFLQPRVEPEIAFILGEDLRGPGLSLAVVAGAIESVVPALELIDSRIRDWKITLADTIADNASSGGVVIGSSRSKLDDYDLPNVECSMSKRGEVVASGIGADVLGNPLEAVVWLANVLGQMGTTLKAGEVILAGSLTASVSVEPGDFVEAAFSGLGSVSINFAKGEA